MTTTTTTTKTPALFTIERQQAYIQATEALYDIAKDEDGDRPMETLTALFNRAEFRDAMKGGFLPVYAGGQVMHEIEAYLAEHGDDAPWVLAVMDGGRIWYAMEGTTINW